MQERMNNLEIAGSSTQPRVRSYDVVTTGMFSTISEKNSNTIFFNKYLSPLVNCLLQTTGVSLVKGSSLKLLASSSELRVLDRGESSISRDSVPHMDRTRDVQCPDTHDRFRVLVYLADSVDSCRNFVTHALPEFGKACAVAQEHIITPLHVVLWTKAHNSSYINYNTPSKTHQGRFRLCVVIDFTLDTKLSSTSIFNNLLEVFLSRLAV